MNGTWMFLTKNLLRCVFMGMLTILLLHIGGASVLALSQSRGQWKVIPSPSEPFSQLKAVAVVSTTDVWAVGGNLSPFTTLIEHWDGTQWSIVPSPNPGSTGNELYGVTAISANNAWAVGYGGFYTLIEHWNGKKWSVVSSPSPGIYDQLYNVTAISANDIWAVGSSEDSNNVVNTLTEHWDGTQWSVVPSANPQGSIGNGFTSVTAISPNNVWAVGYYSPCFLCSQPLIENWNGSKWSVVPSPATQGYAGLNGVAVYAKNSLWAVGYTFVGPNTQTLIEQWNGNNWSIVPSPNPQARSIGLEGVTTVPGTSVSWAVGGAGTQSLIERWNGSKWKVVPSPSPGTSGNSLSGVAASSAKNVWTVGTTNPSPDLSQTLTELYS